MINYVDKEGKHPILVCLIIYGIIRTGIGVYDSYLDLETTGEHWKNSLTHQNQIGNEKDHSDSATKAQQAYKSGWDSARTGTAKAWSSVPNTSGTGPEGGPSGGNPYTPSKINVKPGVTPKPNTHSGEGSGKGLPLLGYH